MKEKPEPQEEIISNHDSKNKNCPKNTTQFSPETWMKLPCTCPTFPQDNTKQKPCFYCQKLHETDSSGVSVCEECKAKQESQEECKHEYLQGDICQDCFERIKPRKECPYCNIKIPLDQHNEEIFQRHLNGHQEPQKEQQIWEERLRDYFHTNADLQIVGEHWTEGMIKIMNGVLKSEIAKAKEERDEKLKKMIIKAINYHKKGFRHDGLENETLDECLLELLKQEL